METNCILPNSLLRTESSLPTSQNQKPDHALGSLSSSQGISGYLHSGHKRPRYHMIIKSWNFLSVDKLQRRWALSIPPWQWASHTYNIPWAYFCTTNVTLYFYFHAYQVSFHLDMASLVHLSFCMLLISCECKKYIKNQCFLTGFSYASDEDNWVNCWIKWYSHSWNFVPGCKTLVGETSYFHYL